MEVVKKRIFYSQADRKGVGLREQMWKFWPIFSIEIWFFDTQNTFYLFSQKCIFYAIFMVANGRPEGPGLMQMIVHSGRPLPMIIQKVAFFFLYVHYMGSKTQPKKTQQVDSKAEGVCVCVCQRLRSAWL